MYINTCFPNQIYAVVSAQTNTPSFYQQMDKCSKGIVWDYYFF